jgi:hypothetical protein
MKRIRHGNAWRRHLTPDERKIVAEADAAKIAWQSLMPLRNVIVNRAVHRARVELKDKA